jgi:hypothetical protein
MMRERGLLVWEEQMNGAAALGAERCSGSFMAQGSDGINSHGVASRKKSGEGAHR